MNEILEVLKNKEDKNEKNEDIIVVDSPEVESMRESIVLDDNLFEDHD